MRNRILRGLALWVVCLASSVAANAACVPSDPGERCNDDRLAATVAGLLSPSELRFVSGGLHHHTRGLMVAANELIWQRAKAQSRDPALRAIAAQMLIDAYLATGLDAPAIALFDTLDASAQKHVTTGPIVFGTFERVDTLYVEASPQLTAAGLAVAYAGAGRTAESDDLVIRAELPVDLGPKDSWPGDLAGPSARAGACIRAFLHADANTDWFVWVFGSDAEGSGTGGCAGAAASRQFQRRVMRESIAAGLPESWLWGIAPNDDADSTDSNQPEIDSALEQLPEVRRRIAALRTELAEIDRLDARAIAIYQQRWDGDPPGNMDDDTVGGPSAADRALARELKTRLEKPVYNPWRILDAPDRAPTAPATPDATESGCDDKALRCQQDNDIRWELKISQDYDPTGEVPAAGLWLIRTAIADGSSRSYYLGIKEHNPFELVDTQDPLVSDGQFRLHVRRAQIDTQRITFPPIGLEFQSDGKRMQLNAALDDIIRDSDTDGLTDLAEQQLLLDPRNADTDGDGIADADDSLPNVAFEAVPTLRRSAFAQALNHILGEPDRALSALVPGSTTFVKRQRTDERTLYLVADPDDLAGISSRQRIVVLPQHLDRALLRKHPSFSIFMPMHLSLKMLDDRHAEIEYSSGWAGGTLALDLRDGAWRIGSLTQWVT